jgi:tetratricopeptide (TPR) repeat protein
MSLSHSMKKRKPYWVKNYIKHHLVGLLVLQVLALVCASQTPVSSGEAETPSSERLGNLLNLSNEAILLKASEAEFNSQWHAAALFFNVYLSRDSTSPTAQRVRQELENIRWRSKVLFTMPRYFEEQTNDLKDARLLYELGLNEEAAKAAAKLVATHPEQSQNYFLAAAALLKIGRFDGTKDCLALGWLRFSERERDLALQMMIQADREERKLTSLQKVAALLKASKFRDADTVYQGLVEEHPGDAEIRQSAIRTAVLAENFRGALKLIEAPLRLPSGETRELPAETRKKLTAEVKKLMPPTKGERPPQNSNSISSKKPSPGPASPKAPTEKPASMAQDFLNRIKK